jgi:hypothetical protein
LEIPIDDALDASVIFVVFSAPRVVGYPTHARMSFSDVFLNYRHVNLNVLKKEIHRLTTDNQRYPDSPAIYSSDFIHSLSIFIMASNLELAHKTQRPELHQYKLDLLRELKRAQIENHVETMGDFCKAASTVFKPRNDSSSSPACSLTSSVFHQALDLLVDSTLRKKEEKQEVSIYWKRIKTKSAQQSKQNTMASTTFKPKNDISSSPACSLSSSVFPQALEFLADATLRKKEAKQEVSIYWKRIKTKSAQQSKQNTMAPTKFKPKNDSSSSPTCGLSSIVFPQALDLLVDSTLHKKEEKQEVSFHWMRIKTKSARQSKQNNMGTTHFKPKNDSSSSPACGLSSSVFHKKAMEFLSDATLHKKEEKQEVVPIYWMRIKTKSAQQSKKNAMDSTNSSPKKFKPRNDISSVPACGLSSSMFHQAMEFLADAALHKKKEKQEVPIYWTRVKTKPVQQSKQNTTALTRTQQKDNKRAIVDELKGVLSAKRARRQNAASIFEELIGKFLIPEMDTEPKQHPIITELNKTFLTKEAAAKKSNTPNNFDERTPAIAVIQGLLKRNALKELKTGSKKASNTVLDKSDPVIQEVLARRKKQFVVKEFRERSNFFREMHKKADAVIHELSTKFVLRELTERAKDKEEWCEKSDLIINDLDYRFALRELSESFAVQEEESFTANEELQEKLSCVVQELYRKFMLRELKESAEEKAIDLDLFLGKDAHMTVQHQLLKKFLIQDLNARARALEEFHMKICLVLQDLKDRFEWVETQEFKQLVIQDLADRSDALQEFHEKSSLVHVELLKKFVLDEVKERSHHVVLDLKEKTGLVLDELNDSLDWVSVHNPNYSAGMMDWVELQDRTEWDICDDDF